jgi:predicted Fe-S protein YdhL (DUF1289 family)
VEDVSKDGSAGNPCIETGNPLRLGIIQLRRHVGQFKERARAFYFDVILSVHPCPECGGRIRMSGKSECTCGCGHVFDPTTAFQKSPCCGQHVVRKTNHYVCPGCQRTVPSLFLFDERLFDKAYFREMVRRSRARAAKRREEMRRILEGYRSGALRFTEAPCLEAVPGLVDDLDAFVGGAASGPDHLDLNSVFKMEDYRNHILDILGNDGFMFSDIWPLMDDARKDRIWRFVTLIFMQNDREVVLTQFGNDLLVERRSGEAFE